MYASCCSIPVSSTMLVVYDVYIAAITSFISVVAPLFFIVSQACPIEKGRRGRCFPGLRHKKIPKNLRCIAKCLPIHIRPPLPKAQNQRIISSWTSFFASSQRSGRHSSGLGKTSGFRCKQCALALTRTPAGNGGELARKVGVGGVRRGWGPGIGAWRRRVSIIVACRSGRVSNDREEGREYVVVKEGYRMGGESVRSSVRSKDWRAGRWESWCM